MSEIKLLPCPFCGGKNVIETYNNFVPVLRCSGCGAMMTIPTASYSTSYKKILVKKWNTRKPMQEILERLEEKKQEYFEGFRTHQNDELYGVACGFGDSIKICKEVGEMND